MKRKDVTDACIHLIQHGYCTAEQIDLLQTAGVKVITTSFATDLSSITHLIDWEQLEGAIGIDIDSPKTSSGRIIFPDDP